MMDDNSPLIVYNPSPTEWETTSSLLTSYFNSSLQYVAYFLLRSQVNHSTPSFE